MFAPLWHEWGSEYIAFDRASGNTHRFDPISANILICLQQGTVTLPNLVECVADALTYEADEELGSHVSELLEKLEQNNFVSQGQA